MIYDKKQCKKDKKSLRYKVYDKNLFQMLTSLCHAGHIVFHRGFIKL